jgi:hypothetical protein
MSTLSLVNRPSCIQCGRRIGDCSPDEAEAFYSSGVSMLCFDCEPVLASHRPFVFQDLHENDFLAIGGLGFQVRDMKLKCIGQSVTRAHERTRARVSSSYTYLNRTQKNSAILGNGLEVQTCQNCKGLGHDPDFNQDSRCLVCKGMGTVACAIVIPLWLIQEGENNV